MRRRFRRGASCLLVGIRREQTRRPAWNGDQVDVKGTDGKVASWAIECGAPNSLLRRGLNKNSIPVGTQLVIDGYQARDGSTTANAKDITLPDGKKFFVGSSGTGAPYEKPEPK